MMNPKQHGMTLVELMVTLAVAAILVSAALPSLSDMAANNRLSALNNQLVSSLNYARSEAVKRRYDVALCVRNSAGTACNASGGFESGWIIFTDCNGDGAVTATNVCDLDGNGVNESAEVILQDNLPNADGVTISSFHASSPRLIRYRPNGTVINNGTLTLSRAGVNVNEVTVAPTGRVKSCKYGATYGACTP
jgi:type IV fimbrial biogenesis protein FimT